MRRCRILLLAPAVAVVGGCAMPEGPAADAPASTAPQRYTISTRVLESPAHGPQLCLDLAVSAAHLSGPPLCDGPDVIGWDWAAVDGEQSDEGTTWGEYRVVGTWDDGALTLTEPPGDPVPDVPREGEQSPGPEYATPCPTPGGGWGIVDPETATLAARDAANEYATEQADLGSFWVDTEADLADVLPGVREQAVLNASFTGDLERHERELRALYGGPLCVSQVPRSSQELNDLQVRAHEALQGEALYSGQDEFRGRVHVIVPVVDQRVRDRIADIDAEGLVDLEGRLQPVP